MYFRFRILHTFFKFCTIVNLYHKASLSFFGTTFMFSCSLPFCRLLVGNIRNFEHDFILHKVFVPFQDVNLRALEELSS